MKRPGGDWGDFAFTLIELLAVMAIVVVLATVTFGVGHSMMESAFTAHETAAARTLIVAYMGAAADNDGRMLAGYDDDADGYDMPDGGSVSAAVAHRYPYRLAPYFDYGLKGVILVNRNEAQIKRAGVPSLEYGASLFPALGMNLYYVGGNYEGGVLDMAGECATRMGQVAKPSSMLVFASAGYGSGETKVDGFYKLEPPNKRVAVWSSSDDDDTAADKPPGNYGNIDFRHQGRAVCAFLDGSVRQLAPRDLRDMRLWNRNAQDQDNPNYHVAVQGPPPGSGGGRR